MRIGRRCSSPCAGSGSDCRSLGRESGVAIGGLEFGETAGGANGVDMALSENRAQPGLQGATP